jgi:hypothetical protein
MSNEMIFFVGDGSETTLPYGDPFGLQAGRRDTFFDSSSNDAVKVTISTHEAVEAMPTKHPCSVTLDGVPCMTLLIRAIKT